MADTARNAFPALEHVGEGFAVAEGEERMDVMGHDDVAPEVVALAVEVIQAFGDDWGEAWITQGAGTVRGVEVFVELVGERAVVAGFGDVVQRRRVRGEEGLASAKPVVEEFTRQRIGETEGDEAGGLSFFCLPPFPCDCANRNHQFASAPCPNFQRPQNRIAASFEKKIPIRPTEMGTAVPHESQFNRFTVCFHLRRARPPSPDLL